MPRPDPAPTPIRPPDPIVSVIRDAIREILPRELRECALLADYTPAVPPPNDVDAERRLAGAVIAEEICPSLCEGLESGDFFDGLARWVWGHAITAEANGFPLSVEHLCALAWEEGLASDRLRPEIEYLAEANVLMPDEAELVTHRLITLARTRKLIDELKGVVLQLGTEAIALDVALAQVAEIVRIGGGR